MSWITPNRSLTEEEMFNNAKYFFFTMGYMGWTIEAICGMLGNIQSESRINPNAWQGYVDIPLQDINNPTMGYGLVQWTPPKKYINWAGTDWRANGLKECQRIDYEATNNLQWFRNPSAPTQNPPITFQQYKTSRLEVETLANYFLWYYEHPSTVQQPQRGVQARAWFDYFMGIANINSEITETYISDVESSNPTQIIFTKKRLKPFLMLSNKHR